MNSKKTVFFTLIALSIIITGVDASQHRNPLDYTSFEPSHTSIYSGNSTSATLNYTINTNYDNCSIATDRSSLPLGWGAAEPNSMDVNSTGSYQIETPKVTAIEYPASSTVRFNLKCYRSNSTSTMPLEMKINLENPSDLPYTFIKEKTPYLVLPVLIIVLLLGASGKIKRKIRERTENSARNRAEKLSQELLQDLQKRKYTPPRVKEKISRAQEKIQGENYEEAITLLEDADQDLDRT